MVCGIKYCGGCNPRFNRTAFLAKLKKSCPEIDFAYVQSDFVYDHLIVINGCLSRCADITRIKVFGDTFKISDDDQFEELVLKLKSK